MYARRDVLRTGAALGLLASSPWLLAAPADSLLTRKVPGTGEALPVIGAGTSGSFEVETGSAEYQRLQQVLQAFFAGGGRIIDTSPNYGGADAILGQLLEDLLQIHNLRDWQRQLPYARELKAQGKTRYVGITHYLSSSHEQVAQIVRKEPLDFVQINYSVNAPEAARALLPLCQDKGVAVLINRAFDDGRLFARVKDMALPDWAAQVGASSWAQLFLKFAISHPAVTAVIPATGRPDRQIDQLKAGHGQLLSEAHQRALIKLFG